MQRFTICIAGCFLALGGCAQLPRSYQTLELGRPLDKSTFPKDVIVREDKENRYEVVEYRQLVFPVGMIRNTLCVEQDPQGRIVRLKLDEYSVSYWILFLAGGNRCHERCLGPDGKPLEEKWDSPPWRIITPLENNLVFLMGMQQCFGSEAKAARQSATQPAQAH
ncbi:MAG: hypothetical protein LLG01_00580 [Planctomycetaceae bacterium]|nr:hypothetical protein [Planctomycetaceae bacterium]